MKDATLTYIMDMPGVLYDAISSKIKEGKVIKWKDMPSVYICGDTIEIKMSMSINDDA